MTEMGSLGTRRPLSGDSLCLTSFAIMDHSALRLVIRWKKQRLEEGKPVMEKAYRAYLPTESQINEFYAGKSSHAADIFCCRFFKASKKRPAVWRFCLWAPNAKAVSVVGDFNDWDSERDVMERHQGLWVCFIEDAESGDNYKFQVKGADGAVVMKADPYAVHAETAPGTASKVWDIGEYAWGDGKWLKGRAASNPLKEAISIYELHLGSWRLKEGYEFPSIREIATDLCEYVCKMGFTHVELMPINEYPFDGSWGYQVTGFFAVTSRFGTPQDYMYFVDTLHQAGIGVIVDWVPAHFPKDMHGLPHFDGTWLYEHKNPIRREHPEWGTYEFNYHRPEVVSFLVSSAMNLVERYHVDGLRVDAVSSMLYLDYGRKDSFIRNKDGGNIDLAAVDFLKALNTAVLGEHPGVITVAEEATSYPMVTKPPYDGGLGFTFKWSMGFMHDTLDYMKSDPFFRHGAHEKMTFSLHYAFSENFILPYSHDEVVHGKASMINKMFGDYLDKFSALKTLYAWLYGHPGKKLLFMGSEFAQFIEWDYKKELDWFLLDYETHASMLDWVRDLNKLYTKHNALFACEDSWDGFQWLSVDDKKNNVFAFVRSDGNDKLICVYNFSGEDFKGYELALPADGKLKLLLTNGDSVKKTATARHKGLNGMPYSVVLKLPPSTALFYHYKMV